MNLATKLEGAVLKKRLETAIDKARRGREAVRDNLLKTISEVEQEKIRQTADLDRAIAALRKELAELGFDSKPADVHPNIDGKRRRSKRADLTTLAHNILDFVKAAGEKGVSGGEIKSKFGPRQNLLEFVKAKTGTALRHRGKTAARRYFV